jgi:hypothetical protein
LSAGDSRSVANPSSAWRSQQASASNIAVSCAPGKATMPQPASHRKSDLVPRYEKRSLQVNIYMSA